MQVAGIITEYNPFHNGHLYHLHQTQKKTSAEAILCIMNGNFMQRGLPALTDKWSRTRMALKNGVDLVIELPFVYGTRSAEYFALGSIKLLQKTNIIDSIVFGSEIGKISSLKKLADIFLKEPEFYQTKLKTYLDQGLSFPKAREKAVIEYISKKEKFKNNKSEIKNIKNTISEPNNILGIEYLKALKKINSSITPYTIKRIGKGYHSLDLEPEDKITSATAIRNKIYKDQNINIKNMVPFPTYQILKNDFQKGKIPIKKEYLGLLVLSKIRKMNSSQLRDYAEIGNGLENRYLDAAFNSGSMEELINNIKTKTITRTRIQRNLLHLLFEVTLKDFEIIDKNGPEYLRVLGFNKTGEKLLSQIKQHSPLTIITQPADYLKSIQTQSIDNLEKQLSFDVLASDIYSLLLPDSSQRKGHNDFYKQIVKI